MTEVLTAWSTALCERFAGLYVTSTANLVQHEAETGGGPTGFGWASFLTLLAGIGIIAFMLGRYLVSLNAARRERADDTPSDTRPGATNERHADFDPYDDLTRN